MMATSDRGVITGKVMRILKVGKTWLSIRGLDGGLEVESV